MKIGELLKYIDYKEFFGDRETEFKGLSADSQNVKRGDLFFCYAGENHDSHEFISDAEKAGAVAVVCEKKLSCGLPQIIVGNGRKAVAPAARAFYGFADRKLKLVGITGTNGKTTTTYMLESIFKSAGKNTGVIGTLGISYADKFVSPELTTPDPIFLHSIFADMLNCGVEYVFMEVSAHALYYDKIHGLKFEVGIFTNCTQDHLDFFKNMNEYSECKKLLFSDGRCAYSVINSDDNLGRRMLGEVNNVISYGLINPADVFAVNVSERIDGTSFVINLLDELYDMKLNLPALQDRKSVV